jgi:cobalamin biosynthesis protein CobT
MPHYCLRAGNKWTIPELIALEREYDLLELPVQEIAERHKRSVLAIVARLELEGIVEDGLKARGYVSNEYDDDDISVEDEDEQEDDDDDYEPNENEDESEEEEEDEEVDQCDNVTVNELSDRVWNLETSVNEIGGIVKQMMELMAKDRKRPPLRAQNQSSNV